MVYEDYVMHLSHGKKTASDWLLYIENQHAPPNTAYKNDAFICLLQEIDSI